MTDNVLHNVTMPTSLYFQAVLSALQTCFLSLKYEGLRVSIHAIDFAQKTLIPIHPSSLRLSSLSPSLSFPSYKLSLID